ncbi:MAG: helix-turn-helix transcriptional regulator, partial [Chloroflexi bacterium]|nr:helix-turn-helix transcriptional regulator [Chloroflexota bacterium]
SQHLMVLRDAGLVQDRRDGWNIFYSVTNPGVFDVLSAAQSATGSHGAPRTHSRKIENCPCPHCNPVADAAAC